MARKATSSTGSKTSRPGFIDGCLWFADKEPGPPTLRAFEMDKGQARSWSGKGSWASPKTAPLLTEQTARERQLTRDAVLAAMDQIAGLRFETESKAAGL